MHAAAHATVLLCERSATRKYERQGKEEIKNTCQACAHNDDRPLGLAIQLLACEYLWGNPKIDVANCVKEPPGCDGIGSVRPGKPCGRCFL